MKKGILWVFLILLGFFCIWFFYLRTAKENKLMKEGYAVVEKVESYRKSNHRLPDSLAQIGISENEETELYLRYDKHDSIDYSVWIGISSEESRFYYSDTKQWEHFFRKMK